MAMLRMGAGLYAGMVSWPLQRPTYVASMPSELTSNFDGIADRSPSI